MYTYQVFEEKLFNDELGSYTAFGISISNANGNVVIKRIHDAFADAVTAEKIVLLCNVNALDPSQFEDVLQDVL